MMLPQLAFNSDSVSCTYELNPRILFVVALDSWLVVQRSTDWQDSLWVVVYPIQADSHIDVAEYIDRLDRQSFQPIEAYISEQADRYNIGLKNVVEVRLGPVVTEQPPLPPKQGSVLDIMWWSLKLRYWSIVMDEYSGPKPDIRVFVLYHPWQDNVRLDHSTGLQKGMVSVVHAFAHDKATARNNMVITHEMLHTLGATDKYNLATGQPLFPSGYAEPDLQPRYPQAIAELMGAYIPISETKAVMPRSLKHTRIGELTAAEIGWLKEEP